MEQARGFLEESGAMMILTDPSGVILSTEGDPRTLDAAHGFRLVSGASWDELACGTNAIGGEPVQVHATEHFCEGIKPWSCSATVIRDPLHGDVLGVLDVSGLAERFHGHWLAVAMMAAGRIEADLAAREMAVRQRLMEAGLQRLSKASSTSVIFFDHDGRLVNGGTAGHFLAAIGAKLDRNAGLRIEAFAANVAARGAALPEWLRPEWVEPVVRGGQRLGTIVVLPDALQREPAQRIVSSHGVPAARRAAALARSSGPAPRYGRSWRR
jgi:transcriptional regulator of acetoin/glycerol metabolism